MVALYDVKNVTAIRELVSKGVESNLLPKDLMDNGYKIAFDLYGEYSARYPTWAKMYPDRKQFRDQIFEWFRIAEYNDDSYVYGAQAAAGGVNHTDDMKMNAAG